MNHVAVTHSLDFGDAAGLLLALLLLLPPARSLGPSASIMEGLHRSLCSLLPLCCLFAGALLPLPGDGQNLSSVPATTVPQQTLPHSEVSNLSIWTTAPAITSVDGNPTITLQVNDSTSSPPEQSIFSTVTSLNFTTGPIQNTENVTNSSVDTASLPTPTVNQSSLDDAKSISTIPWAISSTTFMATEPTQSKTREPTATSHSNSSTFSTLGPTEGRPEIVPVTDQKVITEENTVESTSAAGAVVTNSRVPTLDGSTIATTLTPEAESTLSSHNTAPVETEQAANHVQETSISNVEGYDQPSMPTASSAGEDPLVIAVIFIFIMTIGILAFMGFLRYRQRSSRLQFRRLQDLPMDDMMEETPLSLYSY